MKKRWLLCLLTASMSMPISYAKPAHGVHGEPLDKIVAIVNDDVITQSEFSHAFAIAKIQLAHSNMPAPTDALLRKRILDQMISKKLQLQVAKMAGIQVSDQMLNEAIGRVASQNQMDVNTMYERIRQEGMSVSDYKSEVREQLTLQRLQQQQITARPTISPQEINSFMRSRIWTKNSPQEYLLTDVLVPVPDNPSDQEIAAAKQRAQTVASQLKQGQSIEQLTKITTTSEQALEKNDLGWRKLEEMPNEFATQVTHMQKNGISEPVQTSNGFHILRVTDARAIDAGVAGPTRQQVESLLMQRKYDEAIQTWVSKLRAQSFVVTDPEKVTADGR